MDAGLASGAWNTTQAPRETELDGRRTLRFAPGGTLRGYFLEYHGGGYRLGYPEIEGPFAQRLAAACQVEVVCPQYRIAPEHPFPAGFNDAWAALVALREEIGDAPLIVSGNSAGGGLAAAVAVRAAAEGGPRIDGLVLISAWLDQTLTSDSFERYTPTDKFFWRESAQAAVEVYLQGFDPMHPLVSPAHASLKGLPPALVSVGAGEVLSDDSRLFHERLLAAGGESRLLVIDGMEHVAVVRGPEHIGSVETFAAIAQFVDSITGRD